MMVIAINKMSKRPIYAAHLKENSRQLRQNQTEAEQQLWRYHHKQNLVSRLYNYRFFNMALWLLLMWQP